MPVESGSRVRGLLRQVAALSLLAVLMVILNWAFLEDIEALAFDFSLRLRGEQPPDSRIVIVAIDDASLAETGNWPWPPETLRRLFRNILSTGPSLVGVDLILGNPLASYFDPATDRLVLADSLTGISREDAGPSWQTPLPDAGFPGITPGHIHAFRDTDGVCRSLPLSVQSSGIRRWAFAVELARRFHRLPDSGVRYSGSRLEIGPDLWVPRLAAPIDHVVDAAGILSSLPTDVLLLNPRGSPGTFPYVPAARVLAGEAASDLAGRIVLVGATAYALGDHLGTAFSGFQEMPGIEIHANALDTILNRRFLTAAGELARTGIMLAVLAAAWILPAVWPPARRLSAFIAVLVGIPVVLIGIFLVLHHWLGLVAPVVAAGLAGASQQYARHAGLNRRLNHRFRALSGMLQEVLPRSSTVVERGGAGNLEWKIDLLGDAAEAALRLSKERSETAAFVTHELKTPLTSIQGFAELLQMGDSLTREEREEAARYIQSESRRLASMVQDYLRLARLEQGAAAHAVTGFDLAGILRRAVTTTGPQARDKSIAVVLDIPAGLAVEVRGDPELIHQVFVNLIGNALKFSDPGTRITLSAGREGDHVVGRVADQGWGIPEDQLPRVFEKFFRGSSPGRDAPTGSGLGLAFVRQVVERHGGRISVASRVGHGSTFTVLLPPA